MAERRTRGKHDPPLYRQIADALAEKIRSGHYLPGHTLPSESAITDLYGGTRNTVREAIKLLREQGLIYTEHGRASFVRPTPNRRVIRLNPGQVDVQSVEPGEQPFTALRILKVFPAVADRAIADALAVDIGAPLIARRALMTLRDEPHMLVTSYITRDLAEGTPLAESSADAVERTVEHLAALGHRVTAVERYIGARMPDLVEREYLDIGAITVLTITRTMFAGDQAVEAAVDIVIRADAVEVFHRAEI